MDTAKNPDPSVMPVMAKRCRECLFSSAKIVGDDRREEVLQQCKESGRAFQCHKASIAGEYVVCRGFYDADASLVVVLAKLFGAVKFVELP